MANSIRTINSPGISINEIDKSQYTPPQTVQGTTTFLMGYSPRGEGYNPVFCQSLGDFEKNFGQPKNESERYFYYAGKEILDQGGNLLATRIPYAPSGQFNIENSYQFTGLTFASGNPIRGTGGDGNISLIDPWNDYEVVQMTSGIFGDLTNLSEHNMNCLLPVSSTIDGIGISAHYLLSADYDLLLAENSLDNLMTNTAFSYSARNILSGFDFVVVSDVKTDLGVNQNEGLVVVYTDVFDALASQGVVSNRDIKMNCIENIVMPGTDRNLMKQKDCVNRLWDLQSGDSISEQIMSAWPVIEFNYGTAIDSTTGAEVQTSAVIKPEFLTMLGVSVCKVTSNPEMGGKVLVQVMESFVGSLNKSFKSTASKKNLYIADLINSRSEYIRFFGKSTYSWLSLSPGQPIYIGDYLGTSLIYGEAQSVYTYPLLGYNTISDANAMQKCYNSTISDILTCLGRVNNIDNVQIDQIVDAGLSNIVNEAYQKSPTGSDNFSYSVTYRDPITSFSQVQGWNRLCKELINFCKDTRKDCMVILDAPRQLGLCGNIKRIRKTDPTSNFSNQISFQVKYITGLDSSYAAEYVTWYKMNDGFSGVDFWAPPSVKVGGIYLYNDRVGNIWDAPAGLNRGVIRGITDITFNVSTKEADVLYLKSLNYTKSYPTDGYILEGQKTTQIQPSALDRVNVRRELLKMERFVRNTCRPFLYEANNVFLQRRVFNSLNPYFSDIKTNGGLYDYVVICDERNNTPDTIDNNELRITIGVQPVKTAEYIIVDLVVTRTGANFSEVIGF